MWREPSDETLRDILATPRCIAVVGCSPDPTRDSNRIARLLMARGHRVIPVNPRCAQLLGERCYARLSDIPVRVDVVDVFRRSEEAGAVVDEAIRIGAWVVWLQLGVIDTAAATRAQAAGVVVVMDRCPAIEYARLF